MLLYSICRNCLSRVLSPMHLIRPRYYSEQRESQGQGSAKYLRKKTKFRPPWPKGEMIFGIFPVLLAMQHGKRTFNHMYIKDTFRWTLREDIKTLISSAEEKHIPLKYFRHHELNEMSGGRPHQGICADVSPKEFLEFDTADSDSYSNQSSPQFWIFLDSVKDPMNFGAVLRSSYYFGVDRIIIPERNSCGLTPVVSKASAGAMEIMDVYKVEDSAQFIQERSRRGWRVLGTGRGGETGRSTRDMSDYSLDTDTLLLLGNEGEGLSSPVSSLCQEFLSVPSRFQLDPNFDSLNVSVAAGILLHHFLGKKMSS